MLQTKIKKYWVKRSLFGLYGDKALLLWTRSQFSSQDVEMRCLFGSRCVEHKAPLRVRIYRSSYWTVLPAHTLRGTSGISTELQFKRVEAETIEWGEGGEKKGDWRNLMNIPSGSERGTIYRHQGLPAENSAEKWFQKLQKSGGICRQTEYASRPVHERVREQAACMRVSFCQCASFHTKPSPPIRTLQERGNVNLRAEMFWRERD